MINRRHFQRSALALGLSASTSKWAFLQGKESKILSRAATLATQNPAPLKVIIPAGSRSNFDVLAQSFTAATGAKFDISTVPVDDMNPRTMLSVLAGESIDLALPATFGIPDLVEAGVLKPLNRFADQFDPNGELGQGLFTLGNYYNNKLYGYQTDGDVYLLFYNRDILENPKLAARFKEQHGYAPEPAATWKQLDALLKFYHQPEDNRYGGTFFRTSTYIAWEWWLRIHAAGRLPFDKDMNPQVLSEESIDAAQNMAEASQYLLPNAPYLSIFESWEAFGRGNVLCLLGWGGSQKYLQAHAPALKDRIIHTQAPGRPEGPKSISYFNWGWNLSVPVTANQPELAYLFTLFASDPEVSARAIANPEGFFDPHRREHYADAGIKASYGQGFLKVHRTAMDEAIPDLYLQGRNQYIESLSSALIAINEREFSPKEAMRTVYKHWQELTDTLGRERQIAQWRLVLERYPAHLKRHLT